MLTLLATACYVRTQQQWDPTLGFPGEGGTTDMAHAMGDKCGAHSATFLLQRALCLFLAYFLRARAAKHVATLQRSVLDAMFQKSVASAPREPGPEQQSQITPPANMGGCAIRSPCRKEAAVVTRWAALFDMLPRAQRALMDSCVSRPGSLERGMIDVRTVDGKCATAGALGGTDGAFKSAEQEQQRRYKGHAHALSVELRGGIASTGLSLLEQLSWEAAIAKPSNGSPTRLVRQWCRELELVPAFEAAEVLRAVHGDSKRRRVFV